jgi:flagellar assembly protein FliH
VEPSRDPEPAAPDPQLTAAFEQALTLLARERERLLVETAGQVAELAALIARRVIGRELSLDPMLVRELVREGIEVLGQHDRVLVRVGAAFETTRQALLEELLLDGGRVEVRLDPSLSDYGCVVETELGQVDESIESRLETLLHAVRPDSNPPG